MRGGSVITIGVITVGVLLRCGRPHGDAGCAGVGNGLATRGRRTMWFRGTAGRSCGRHTGRATSGRGVAVDPGGCSGGVFRIFPWRISGERVSDSVGD